MALVPYPDPSKLSPEARQILQAAPQNISRFLAGAGPLFKPWIEFASAMFTQGSVSPVLRELITCRIGHRLNAGYVLDQHLLMARSVGVTDEQMAAISGPLPSPAFSEHDNAALLLVDAQMESGDVAEEVVLNAHRLLGEQGLIEVFLIAGFYHSSARLTKALRVDLDAAEKGNGLTGIEAYSASDE